MIKNKLYNHKVEIESSGKELTAFSLKNAYIGISRNRKIILEIFADHNQRCKSLINIDFATGTYERYEAC